MNDELMKAKIKTFGLILVGFGFFMLSSILLSIILRS